MPCFHPIDAWQGPNGGPVIFKPSGYVTRYLQVPCGQCIGCRLERSRQWAVRCVHENACWDVSSFLTLTYSDDNLPPGGTLVKSDFQKFMKRLRDRMDYPPMAYYMCGEYGERFGRPHYHALLFGIHFDDREFFTTTAGGNRLYTSAFLDGVWQLGHCQIGEVTFDSAAYVARYCVTKPMGRNTAKGVRLIDPNTGEVLDERIPEYNDMSRRRGIGRDWLERYSGDVYPRDEVVVNAAFMKPPRYYDNRFEIMNEVAMREIKLSRRVKLTAHAANNTPDRLAVREDVVVRRRKLFKRNDGV